MSVLTSLERHKFRKIRVRTKVSGSPESPRLSVCRTSKHIYLQLVDDMKGHTLASASSVDADFRATKQKGSTIEGAKAAGKLIAERAKVAGIKKVVFDRGGRPYHGRVKAAADGAREAGLEF